MIYYLTLNLIIAHIIADFYLQTNSFCRMKAKLGIKGTQLWIHSMFVGILSWIVVGDIRGWWLSLLLVLSHFFIDWLKPKAEHRLLKWQKDCSWVGLTIFLVDQFLHVLCILFLADLWFDANSNWTQWGWVLELISDHPLRVKTFLVFLLVVKPANILILLILKACNLNIEVNEKEKKNNFHAGRLIGLLERCLIVLFVVLSQYEAIGFLIAAKSILRFSEATSGSVKSEYVLTGTLLSLTIALCLGLVAVKWNI